MKARISYHNVCKKIADDLANLPTFVETLKLVKMIDFFTPSNVRYLDEEYLLKVNQSTAYDIALRTISGNEALVLVSDKFVLTGNFQENDKNAKELLKDIHLYSQFLLDLNRKPRGIQRKY